MKKILLISDTHSFFDDRLLKHIENADEIWHAGDIGSIEVLEKIESLKAIRAVFGNIDDHKIRVTLPKNNIFILEGVKVFMTHIGGKVGRYNHEALRDAQLEYPQLFICGHSHILQIMFDKKNNWLYLNPGAMGKYGIQTVQTTLSFELNEGKIENMNLIEFVK